jgi:hypothetical protein
MDLPTIIGTVAVGSACTIAVALLSHRAARKLEEMKVELTKLSHLRTSAEEKRASVAAEGLVATLSFLSALENLTSRVYFKIDGAPLKSAPTSAVVEDRWRAFLPYEDDFQRAWHLVEVYLPDTTHNLFERTSNLRWTVKLGQEMFVTSDDPEWKEGGRQKGFGRWPAEQIRELRDEARRHLRPLAQLMTVK